MLRAIKSYLAFAGIWYKLVMLVLVPILLVVVNAFVFPNEVGIGMESLLLLYAVDIYSDFFFMRGFYRKNSDGMAFMQSSPKFRMAINEIVIIDFIRRVLVYQIPFWIVLWRSQGDEGALEWCRTISVLPWIEALTTQLIVLVIRHFWVWYHVHMSLVFGYIAMMLVVGVAMYAGIESNGGMEIGINSVLIVLLLITALGTVWYTDKKMKESYYD